MNKKITFSYKI